MTGEPPYWWKNWTFTTSPNTLSQTATVPSNTINVTYTDDTTASGSFWDTLVYPAIPGTYHWGTPTDKRYEIREVPKCGEEFRMGEEGDLLCRVCGHNVKYHVMKHHWEEDHCTECERAKNAV